jgi:hypothetical protein
MTLLVAFILASLGEILGLDGFLGYAANVGAVIVAGMSVVAFFRWRLKAVKPKWAEVGEPG